MPIMPQTRKRRRSSRLFQSVFVLSQLASYSLSFDDLRFLDGLRLSSPEDADVTTEGGSSVVRINVARQSGDNGAKTESYRLCDLASLVPQSEYGERLEYMVDTAGAALLGLLHFNQRNSSIVPELASEKMKNCDVMLTEEFHDTELSPIVANRILTEDLVSRDHSLRTPRPCAVIGASRSAVSAPLSIMASVHDLPVISSMSTSHQLDNKGIYRLFGRTIPTDEGRAQAAVSYLRDVLQVTHCGVLYLQDEWGSAFNSAFTRAAFALDPPMRIVSASYNVVDGGRANGEGSIQRAINRLKSSGFHYFFGIVSDSTYEAVMSIARREGVMGPGRFWLFGEVYLGGSLGDHGVAVMDLGIKRNEAFEQAWTGLQSDAVKEYFLSKHTFDFDLGNWSFSEVPSYWEYLEYDAVIAVGIAACEAKDEFFTGSSLFHAFTRTSFTGASGAVGFDHETGSRDATQVYYRVANVAAANRPDDPGGVTYTSNEVFHQVRDESDNGHDFTMRWNTTSQTIYSDGSNIAPPVLPPKEGSGSRIGVGALVVGLTCAAVVIAMSLVWGIWTIRNRTTKVVRSSQPEFLLMLCTGTFIMGCSIIPMSLQEPVSQGGLNIACMAFPWLFSLGWVVSFSALFSKTLRIYKLMSRSRAFCHIKIEPKDVLRPFLTLLSCNAIVLVAWTIVAPLTWVQVDVMSSVDMFGRSIKSYAVCRSVTKPEWPFVTLLVVMDIGCLVYAVFVNYRARHIPSEYSETYYISICVVSILQAFVVGVPVLTAVSKNLQANFIIRSFLVAIVCAAVLVPLFVPKVKAKKTEKKVSLLRDSIKQEKEKRLTLSKRNMMLREELEFVKNVQKVRSHHLHVSDGSACCTDTDLSSGVLFEGSHHSIGTAEA